MDIDIMSNILLYMHALNSNSTLPGAGHSEGEGRQIIIEVAPRLVKP